MGLPAPKPSIRSTPFPPPPKCSITSKIVPNTSQAPWKSSIVSTSSPPSNKQSDIYTMPQVSPPNKLGSRASAWETTSHGPSSPSIMSTSFPELEETQKYHMRNQRQIVCSTKPKETSPISRTSASAAPTLVDDVSVTAVGLNRRKFLPYAVPA